MIIAIASEGKEIESAVNERFGRAPYFIIHDTDSGSNSTEENSTNVMAAHGAGIGAAQAIVSNNVDVVVSGKFGPKAEDVLSAAGIRMVAWSEGTVAEAIEYTMNK